MKFKSLLIVIILLLVIIIFVQNTEVVDFKIYFWQLSMSRIILFPALVIIGFIVGFISAKIHRYKRTHQKPEKESVE